MVGTVYLVGTPIGNLGDISPRGLETLRTVDFIAVEDTRITRKLLSHFEIKKPLISYFAHNRRVAGEKIVTRVLAGESCALVTDAGMPGISDPGEELVAHCRDAGIPVVCVPGPSAVVAALALSGLPTGRFTFEGFLSTATKNRREHLKSLVDETRTMVFFEAPHKVIHTLEDMQSHWGDRRVTICRELTKRYEETVHTTLGDAVARYHEEAPRGEFVLVVAGAAKKEVDDEDTQANAFLQLDAMISAGQTVKDAVRACAESTGVARNVLYAYATKKDASES